MPIRIVASAVKRSLFRRLAGFGFIDLRRLDQWVNCPLLDGEERKSDAGSRAMCYHIKCRNWRTAYSIAGEPGGVPRIVSGVERSGKVYESSAVKQDQSKDQHGQRREPACDAPCVDMGSVDSG